MQNQFHMLLPSCGTLFRRRQKSRLKTSLPSGTLPHMDHLRRARQVFDIEWAALKAVRQQLDGKFDAAANIIIEALEQRGKIVVVGIGKSGNVGQKIAATLTSTGSMSVFLHSVDALHGDLGIVNDGDAIIALSYSGESEELLNLIPPLKRFSVKIICITGAVKSALAHYSDVVLSVRVPKEACPFDLAPTASTTAMMVMGDALAMAVSQARGFKQKDYARHHPSGAIGRALLKVSSIMRTGDRNAVAGEAVTVKEALLIMSRAKSGSVSVVNRRGKLVGVFTDGDLRRHVSDDGDVRAKPLSKVMTRKPVCIRDDELTVEALKIFNQRNIDDLIVVNARREPIGFIDSQDLPKMKLM
jgi:arabinose-5-phosphate isomerase